MCSIAFSLGNQNNSEIVKSILRQTQHRGPDNTNIINYDNYSIGHNRLKIIDLKERSNQPFVVDNKYILAFNGEIYNFKWIRSTYNIHCNTDSDTEVIIRGYAKIKQRIFDIIEGFFSICLVDITNNHIFLARDKFGKKPLYYYKDLKKFIVSSENKPLIENITKGKIDINSLNYLLKFGYNTNESSIVQNIHKVAPGYFHQYKIINNDVQLISKTAIQPDYLSTEKSTAKLLDISINKRLIADRKIGCLISGGIDSTLLGLMLNKLNKDITFYYYLDENYSKEEYDIIKKLKQKIDIQIVKSNKEKIIPILEKIDEPFGDLSIISTYKIIKAIPDEIKVIFSGDGADEIFSGYPRYHIIDKLSMYLKIRNKLPVFKYKTNCKFINLLLNPNNLYEDLNIYFTDTERRNILKNNYYNNNINKSYSKNLKTNKDLCELDINTILPNMYLQKIDRCSMLCSKEARNPYLDLNLYHNTRNKIYKNKNELKNLIQHFDPSFIINKKIGFQPSLLDELKQSGELSEFKLIYFCNDFGLWNIKETKKLFNRFGKNKTIDSKILLIVLINIYLKKVCA